jgi:tetratricopeptide (TPR) repeat protein
MKTLLTFFIITILFNFYSFAQREIKTGGKGQESGRIERIKRNPEDKRIIVKHPGTIERPPIKTAERPPERPLRKESGVPIEVDQCYCCPEITPSEPILIDIIYNSSPYQPSLSELAIQCFESEDCGRALLYLDQSLVDEPFNAELYFLRGKVYFELNDYIQAIRDFSTVNVLDPLFPDAYYYRGMSNLYLGDMKLAIEDFKIAASLGDTLAERFVMKYSN